MEQRAFELVTIAQAFHWIDRGLRYTCSAVALKPGDLLAPFWYLPDEAESALEAEIAPAYTRTAPEMPRRSRSQTVEERHGASRAEIEGSGTFHLVKVQRFPRQRTLTTTEYLSLLGTYSDHVVLDPDARQLLFEGIRAPRDGDGGAITRRCACILFMVRAL
ncbi:MAG: hypothetical protein KGJ62_01000 [Armatimonadetes bacterium]|nr:hypothetical protein [Armatimonadota bacterium]MDE2207777.1 hypothetical protein [Armatimonadota bacterium]